MSAPRYLLPGLLAFSCLSHAASANSLADATVTASSQYSASFPATNAIDGVISDTSRWLTANVPGPHWLELNLPEARELGGYALFSGWQDQDAIAEFYLEERQNGQWVKIESSQVTGNASQRVNLEFDRQVITDGIRLVLPANGIHRVREVVAWAPGEMPTFEDGPVGPVGADDPVILLNQSGYNLSEPKRFTALNLGPTADFVIETTGGIVVYAGQLAASVGDFSDFEPRTEGEFVVKIGSTVSVPFRIGPWWLERVTYQNAMDFMIQARNRVGNVTSPAQGSFGWRDDHHFAFWLRSLVDQYASNPAAYERMPGQVAYEPPRDNAWGALEPYDASAPDIVKLIHWSADVIVTQGLTHELLKGELASFLYAWPLLEPWLPAQNYDAVKTFALNHWEQSTDDRDYPYDETASNGHDLLALKTNVGTTKGAYPPGFSVLPNTLMAEVLEREGDSRAEIFRNAARDQVAWMIANLDPADPQVTKGQRMSENLLMMGLAVFARLNPQRIPNGFDLFIANWNTVAIRRANNFWDFRKLSDGDAWVPFIDGVRTAWNEPGNVVGFPAAALEAEALTADPTQRQRLRELAWAAFDNMFGRNPVGRHFSFDAPTEIEGVERGWFSFHQGGIGQLAGVPFVLDGAPKNEHYPYDPAQGDIGWTEGWVNFNTAFNRALAVLAYHGTSVHLHQRGDRLNVRLQAPLNFDYTTEEPVAIIVASSSGDWERVELRESAPYAQDLTGHATLVASTGFTGDNGVVEVQPGDTLSTSYGFGYYERRADLPVETIEPLDADADGLPDDWERLYADDLAELSPTASSGLGSSTLQAFAFGLDPTAEQSPTFATSIKTEPTGRWFVVHWSENSTHPEADTTNWEQSTNLRNWNPLHFDGINADIVEASTDTSGLVTTRQLRARIRIPATGSLFLRSVLSAEAN